MCTPGKIREVLGVDLDRPGPAISEQYSRMGRSDENLPIAIKSSPVAPLLSFDLEDHPGVCLPPSMVVP